IVLRDESKDEGLAELAGSVAAVVTEGGFMDKAQAARDGGAADIAGVAADLDSLGLEGLEGEAAEQAHGLRHVAPTLGGNPQPVADFKGRNIPVDAMQAGPSQESTCGLLPYPQSQVFPCQPARMRL